MWAVALGAMRNYAARYGARYGLLTSAMQSRLQPEMPRNWSTHHSMRRSRTRPYRGVEIVP